MPTNQPSSAPDAIEPREDATAGAVLHDEQADMPPGGGGLGGVAAGGQRAAPAGTSPNSPIDVPLPVGSDDDGMPPSVDAQARREAVDTTATDAHPSSQ